MISLLAEKDIRAQRPRASERRELKDRGAILDGSLCSTPEGIGAARTRGDLSGA